MTAKRPAKKALQIRSVGSPSPEIAGSLLAKRLKSERAETDTKKAPAKAVAAEPQKSRKRLRGAPRTVGPVWKLTDHEKDYFDRIYRVSEIIGKVEPHAHSGDKQLLFNGLAAAFGFHELSKLIDQLEWDDSMEDVQSELKQIRVAFELSLQALDIALNDRANHLEKARVMALARWEADPAGQAMLHVHEEWVRWQAREVQYSNDSAFARAMAVKHPEIKSEGSIKNAASKWRMGK